MKLPKRRGSIIDRLMKRAMFSRDSPATADNRKRFYERVEGLKRTRRWPLYALRIAFQEYVDTFERMGNICFLPHQLICLTMNTLKCIKHQKDGSLLQTHTTAALRRLGGLNSSRYTTLVLSRTPAKLLELGEAPECELHCKEMLLPATTAQREAKHASRFH